MSDVMHVTQRRCSPDGKRVDVFFFAITGDGVISETASHEMCSWQYAAPHDENVTMLLERVTTFERMIYDYQARIAELEKAVKS